MTVHGYLRTGKENVPVYKVLVIQQRAKTIPHDLGGCDETCPLTANLRSITAQGQCQLGAPTEPALLEEA